MGLKTPLYETHVAAGARLVDFGGWDMPVHYGSQIEEHHAVRRSAGMFDVSHMLGVDVSGEHAGAYLRRLLANDVARLHRPGKALYSCMLNDAGGVIDDLIVYCLGADSYRLVVNAGNREKDLAWMMRHAAGFRLEVRARTDLAMIAVQGPQARSCAAPLLAEHGAQALALEPFSGRQLASYFISRTGYTGEDGWEIMLPAEQAPALWASLQQATIRPCGLGARDTLRLEAGMNLYGNDMDEQVSPLECALAWTVAFEPAERDFIGRAALRAQQAAGVARKLVALVLQERGVLRSHQKVLVPGIGEGQITSGTFSPTLQRSIGLARVPAASGAAVLVEIRGRQLPAQVVKPPFVRHGRVLIGAGGK